MGGDDPRNVNSLDERMVGRRVRREGGSWKES